ncbi:ABC transporter permease [Youngiibacter fragilis]|uniref:ABC transporter permease n=1 Tax=Youngiibacter fragilis 232.1 TaxID=994573 RepID=V7I622_9CLOT|nr:ABC transporter permease [Youngiibacter fragilis]ETA80746.1 ABC transporter permease [Youngiibacter fragilis 232.1]
MNTKKIERRYDILRTLIAIGIALVLALMVIVFISENPLDAMKSFLFGPVSSFRRFANVIELMIPITFTALGICVMYQAAQFNLIGEGVFFFSGAVATWFALNLTLPAGVHAAVVILLSASVGALIALIPAILKVKWKASEVVSSIMMNYVLQLAGIFLLMYYMKDMASGFNASYIIPATAKLPVLIAKTRIHAGLIIVVVMIILVYLFLYKSKWGYEIRMTGENQNFAKYSGIKVNRVILYASLIGGFLAGMGGAIEILGMYTRFQWEKSPGYGWDGMLVAILAKKNPSLVPLSAFFLAYLRIGADVIARTSDVPVEFVSVIQAIVIMFIAAEMFLAGMKHRAITKESRKQLELKEGK